MISFVPDFANLELEDAYKAQISSTDKGDFLADLDSAPGEFVFVLDRSGSMDGKRIEKAKEALQLFLKSMPEGSFFNIISFGGGFEKLFANSVPYEEQFVDQAIE